MPLSDVRAGRRRIELFGSASQVSRVDTVLVIPWCRAAEDADLNYDNLDVVVLRALPH